MPCRKGQKHSGHFKKGFDPRRNLKGQYLIRDRVTVEQKFREHSEKALKALLAVIEDSEAPHKDVVNAANSLLDRAYGKAVDRVQVATLSSEGGSTASLTRDELMARLTQQYTAPELGQSDGGESSVEGGVVDGDWEEVDYSPVESPNYV